jgi:hypothetical protein
MRRARQNAICHFFLLLALANTPSFKIAPEAPGNATFSLQQHLDKN